MYYDMKTEELVKKVEELFQKEYSSHIKLKPTDENGLVSVKDH